MDNTTQPVFAMEQDDVDEYSKDNVNQSVAEGLDLDEFEEDIGAMPKQMILITLISKQPSIFNPKHEDYRNPLRRDTLWNQIAKRIGWTDKYCRSKWKAMRDQYCRELKRSRTNPNAIIKWKYYNHLEFLRPYSLYRQSETKWTNPGQFEMLIRLMKTNTEIAKGITGNKTEVASFWEEVNEKLNNLGPPYKDATSWKKVWIDFKGNVKKKLVESEKRKTQSEDDSNPVAFSPLEEAVIRITEMDKAILGLKARNFETINLFMNGGKSPTDSSASTSKDASDESPTLKFKIINQFTPDKKRKRNSSASASTSKDAFDERPTCNFEILNLNMSDEIKCTYNLASTPRDASDERSFDADQYSSPSSPLYDECPVDMLNEPDEIEMDTPTVSSKLDNVISNLEQICKSLEESNNEQRRHNLEMEKIERGKIKLRRKILDLQSDILNRF